MAKLNTAIKFILETAGLTVSDPKFAAVMALDTEFPDDALNTIYENVFNEFGVLNSQKFTDKFHQKAKKEIYDGLDAKLEATAKKFNFTDAEITDLKKITNSFERSEKMISILQDKSTAAIAAAKGTVNADTAALTQKIAELNKQVVDTRTEMQTAFDAEKNKLQTEFKERNKTNLMDNFLATKSWANKNLPPEVSSLTAKTLFQSELAKKGAQLILSEDGRLKLVQVANPALDYTEQNKTVSFQDYADRVFAENKLLEITDPTGGKGDKDPIFVPQDPNIKPNLEGMALFDRQLAALNGN